MQLRTYERNRNKIVADRDSCCQPGKNRHSNDSGYLGMRKVTRPEFTQLRERAGLSLDEAAELIEVSERTAYRYDAGKGAPTKLAVRTLREAAEKRRTAD